MLLGFSFVRLLVGAASLKRRSAALQLAGDISGVVIWEDLGLPERKKRKLFIWFGLINKTSLLCAKACGCAKVNKTLR